MEMSLYRSGAWHLRRVHFKGADAVSQAAWSNARPTWGPGPTCVLCMAEGQSRTVKGQTPRYSACVAG